MSSALPISVHMTSTMCWCGTPFSCPTNLYEAARDGRMGGHQLHCPQGHSMSFKTRVQELEQQVTDLNRRLVFAKNETAAVTRKLTRVERRAKAGICIECNRTFQNVSRHMKTKHGGK